MTPSRTPSPAAQRARHAQRTRNAHPARSAHPALATLGALAILLAGCAAPSATPAPTGTPPTATAPSPSPGTTDSGAPAPTPTAALVELTADGLTGVPFGTSLAEVQPWLVDRLGDPDEVVDDDAVQTGGIPTRILRWQGLRVAFEAPGSPAVPHAFATWWLWPDEGVPAGAAPAASLPVTPTFAELQQRFPAGELRREDPLTVFRLPDGVRYGGEDALRPAWLAAGVERPAE